MSDTKLPFQPLERISLDRDAHEWIGTFFYSQLESLKRKGNHREVLSVLAEILQRELHGMQRGDSLYRELPDAHALDFLMRAVLTGIDNPRDYHHILSSLEAGLGAMQCSFEGFGNSPYDELRDAALVFVDLGTHPNLIALCDEIEEKVQPVNESVIQHLLPHWKPENLEETTVEVCSVFLEELGVREERHCRICVDDIFQAADERGLEKLPLDAPLQLLLRPLKLLREDDYVVMTDPIDGRFLCIRNSEKGLDCNFFREDFKAKTRLILGRKYP